MAKSRLPKHLQNLDTTPQVRGRKYESNVAKALKGRLAVNSGATFGQNDIIADYCEVEAKLTTNSSYSLKAEYFKEVKNKCAITKIPLMVINFEAHKSTLAVMPMEDLEFLLETIQNLKSD